MLVQPVYRIGQIGALIGRPSIQRCEMGQGSQTGCRCLKMASRKEKQK